MQIPASWLELSGRLQVFSPFLNFLSVLDYIPRIRIRENSRQTPLIMAHSRDFDFYKKSPFSLPSVAHCGESLPNPPLDYFLGLIRRTLSLPPLIVTEGRY